MRLRYIFIVNLLLVCFLFPVFAQETKDNLRVYDLQDTIVVIADRYALPLKEMTYTHDIIPGEKVKQMTRHSVLEMVDIEYPSAYILDNKILGYGVGKEGAGILNIRGQGGKPNTGILVLLNGHPDFMGLFGHPLPDVYGMDDVDQVEILAGPASSVFGSQAMGGVINIKTAPDYDHILNLSFIGGSYGTYNLGLNLAKRFSDHGLYITLRQNHTNGHIEQTSFESLHLQAGWEWQINPNWRISLQGRYVPYQFDDPSRTTDPAQLGMYGKIRRGTGEVILENRDKRVKGSTQIYGNWGYHRFYDGFNSHDFTYGISSYQQLKIATDLNVAVGGDLIYYGGQAENKLIPPGIVDETQHKFTQTGLYALMMYNIMADLSLKFGLRYQYNSLPLQNLAPVAGITYNILRGLKIYANYQSGFRFPTLNELYLFPTRNPDLKEQNIRGIEAGIWYYWGAKNTMRFTIFDNHVENLITNPMVPPPGQFVNSGKARQNGVEMQVTYSIFSNFGIQLSYSFLNPDQITAYNPRHQIKYLLNFMVGNFRSVLYGKYIDHLYAGDYSQFRLADYNLINVTLAYTVMSFWDVNLKLLNLLDRRYEVQPNFPAPGRYFLAGFEFRL